MAQMVENLLVMLETWAGSLGQEDPVKEEMANSSILAGEPHEQRSLAG